MQRRAPQVVLMLATAVGGAMAACSEDRPLAPEVHLIAFEQPPSLTNMPSLTSSRLEARSVTLQYASNTTPLRGIGDLPEEAVARESVKRTLQSLMDYAEQHPDSPSVDVVELKGRLNDLNESRLLVSSVRVLGARDDAVRYADSIGVPYTLSPPSSSDRGRVGSDSQPLLQNSGQESDWHPTSGKVTWWRDSKTPGFVVEFTFDERSLSHYDDTRDAYEIELSFPGECFDEPPFWVAVHSNLPRFYEDTQFGDGSARLSLGAGTPDADLLEPWYPYYVWLPANETTCNLADREKAIDLWSQPSAVAWWANPLVPSAYEVFARGDNEANAGHIDVPIGYVEDDMVRVLRFQASDLLNGVAVSWARNLCEVPGQYTGALAPCVFLSSDNFAECYQSCSGENSLCNSSASCEPARSVRGRDLLFQLGHGFTRNSTAHCVATNLWGEIPFDVSVGSDSEFTNPYRPRIDAGLGPYRLRCKDITGTWSNEVRFEILDALPSCSCLDSDGDQFFSVSCVDSDCSPRTDCRDDDPGIHPGAAEICGNGLDDDCVGGDASCPATCSCSDSDGDHFYSAACTDVDCSPRTDCNDSQSAIHPGAVEICGNGLDDDCDATTSDTCPSQNTARLTVSGVAVNAGEYVCVSVNGGPAQRAVALGSGTYQATVTTSSSPMTVDSVFWAATSPTCTSGWTRDFWPASNAYSLDGTTIDKCVPRPENADWRYVRGTLNSNGTVTSSGTLSCPGSAQVGTPPLAVNVENVTLGVNEYVCASVNGGAAQRATALGFGAYQVTTALSLPATVDSVFWAATSSTCTSGWLRDFWPVNNRYSVNGTTVDKCVPRSENPNWRYVRGTVDADNSVANSGTLICPGS
jgi:hypothetical protein